MKEAEDYEKDLASIRSIMERSVKFISLSGLSGVLSGIYALIGTYIAYRVIYYSPVLDHSAAVLKLELTALIVLISSLITGFLMSLRKARKMDTSLWNATSKQLFKDLAISLGTGGFFILALLIRNYYFLLAPSCLIFYGLALIQASRSTYAEIMFLGLTEISLGLIGIVFPGYGLILWATGFGVMHVIYGAVMYFRYER